MSQKNSPSRGCNQQQRSQPDVSDLASGMFAMRVTMAQTTDNAIIGIKEELSGIRAQLQADEWAHFKKQQVKGMCRNVARKEVQEQNAHVQQSIEEIRTRIDGLTDMVSGWMNTMQANTSSHSKGDGSGTE